MAKVVAQKVYAFDIDDSLNIGPRPGPIEVKSLKQLMDEGHIVGICGNHRVAFQFWPTWYTVISFFGGHPPLGPYKPQFLQEIKGAIYLGNPKIVDYCMVGNTKADAVAGLVAPTSNDDGYARLAGWRFLAAEHFAQGYR
jgi:hypothetical protein